MRLDEGDRLVAMACVPADEAAKTEEGAEDGTAVGPKNGDGVVPIAPAEEMRPKRRR